MASRLNELADWLWDWMVRCCLHRTTRLAAAWLLAVVTGGLVLDYGWRAFRHEHRSDGNSGHTTIDFGGQWLMAAMIVQGEGENLYHRPTQRRILHASYAANREAPEDKKRDYEKRGDAENLMSWFMGSDSEPAAQAFGSFALPVGPYQPLAASALAAAGQTHWTPEVIGAASQRIVGGPLYPPIHALLFAPLGLLDPLDAYHVNQILCLVWALGAGFGVHYLTRGRIWAPIAFTIIVLYAGFRGALHLGQNPPLTLIILIWGWALLARGKDLAGGCVWGLLAFKPVWALAFFLVPLLTRRWRFALAMLGTAALLALATVPVVGAHSWLEWLQVGRIATDIYNRDQNWIFLSRDLLGLPRRFLLDFEKGGVERLADRLEPALLGWVLVIMVLEMTLRAVVMRPSQARDTTGPAPAFLLLAAWLSCYHFMYYDVLLSALPVFVLLAEPRKLLQPTFVALVKLPERFLDDDCKQFYLPLPGDDYPPSLPLLQVSYQHLWVLSKLELNLLALLFAFEHLHPHMSVGLSVSGFVPGRLLVIDSVLGGYHLPWDTLLLFALWLWSGWMWFGSTTEVPGQLQSSSMEGGAEMDGSTGADAASAAVTSA